MTPWEVNRIYQQRENHINYPGSGKIPLKIKIEKFILNKRPTKFHNIPTLTSTQTGGDNKF